MTIIVAARAKKGIIIAADSQTTAGWEKLQADRSKLWTADPYAFGAAGCVRTSQIIRHYTSWPKHRPAEDTDLEAFLVKSVVPAIRAASKDHGVVVTSEGRERLDSHLVIAWGDNLATVHGNGAVIVPRLGRIAVGSGYAEALGFLGDRGPWTVDQVVEAARRATISADGCDGPIDYVVTDDLKVQRGMPPTRRKRVCPLTVEHEGKCWNATPELVVSLPGPIVVVDESQGWPAPEALTFPKCVLAVQRCALYDSGIVRDLFRSAATTASI